MSLNRDGVIARWRCRFGVVGPVWKHTGVSRELQSQHLVEVFWKVLPQTVKAR
jgi:hypothetical protein